MRRLITYTALCLSCLAYGQDWKRSQNLYFGDSAGLTFATDPPTVLADGQMYALEGCATMSDTAGNLLFYTNGQTVWNKNHQVMKNGTGLLSNQTYAQAALIIPQPGNDSVYLIFTTGHLYYSVVNINGEGGLGEILEKNIFLIASGTEKLAATHHSNGRDVWVATHGGNNNYFYSILVTENGVVHCPIISEVGSVMTGGANQTEMRFSPSGRIAGVLFWNDGFMEVLNFDNRTGRFSNPIKIITSPGWVSGLAFSNDEKWLILSARWRWIRSYSLDTLNIAAINTSMRTLYMDATSSVNGQFCNTHDNRLLFNWAGKNYLGGIQFGPADTQITFIDSAVSIAPRTGTYGMPQFISSYFYHPKLDIHYKTSCLNDSVAFSAKSSQSLVSPSWDIYWNGNPLYSGGGQTLNYFFQDTGTYSVRLVDNGDTVNEEIFIEPHLELGQDTLICNVAEFNLTLPDNIRCIQWQNGSDTGIYPVTGSGMYYVSGYNNKGCLVSDSIRVKMGNILAPVITRSGDSLYSDTGSYAYQWYHNGTAIGNNDPSIIVKQTGNYQVEITDSIGCTAISNPFPVTLLSMRQQGNSTVRFFPNPLREGETLTIDADEELQSIIIYDVHGKIVFQKLNTGSNRLEIPMSNRGIFFIQINHTLKARIIIN